MHKSTCRTFAKLSTTIAAFTLVFVFAITGAAISANEKQANSAQDDKLQSEFLLDLTLEAQTPQNLGSAWKRPSHRAGFRRHVYGASPKGHHYSSRRRLDRAAS